MAEMRMCARLQGVGVDSQHTEKAGGGGFDAVAEGFCVVDDYLWWRAE